MVIDTSALLVILTNEPDAAAYAHAIADDLRRLISAASLLETAIVVETRYGEPGGRELDLLIYKAAVQIAPVDSDQIEVARQAYRRFGKGRHPASLNFGDCFSYALAAVTGEPLLFKGRDFALTDISTALPG